MTKVATCGVRLGRCEQGVSYVEYLVLIAVVGLAGVAIFRGFSGGVTEAGEAAGSKLLSLIGGGDAARAQGPNGGVTPPFAGPASQAARFESPSSNGGPPAPDSETERENRRGQLGSPEPDSETERENRRGQLGSPEPDSETERENRRGRLGEAAPEAADVPRTPSPSPGPPPVTPPPEPFGTGLDANVDAVLDGIPQFRSRVVELQSKGWTIRYGSLDSGLVGLTTWGDKTITVSSNLKGTKDNDYVLAVLAHEMGHAVSEPIKSFSTDLPRDEYIGKRVQNVLEAEARATLERARLRLATGLDLHTEGSSVDDHYYDQRYLAHEAGKITWDEAVKDTASSFNQYNPGLVKGTTDKAAEAWDKAHP